MLEFNLKSFFSKRFGICIKDQGRKILFQNQFCNQNFGCQRLKNCENVCSQSNGETSPFPSFTEGMKLFKFKNNIGQIYDVVIINDGKYILTISYLLTDKIKRELEFLKNFQLSLRELEVISFVLQGMSNLEISHILFISQATLRTHLNNIYKKLPAEVVQLLKSRETNGFKTLISKKKNSVEGLSSITF